MPKQAVNMAANSTAIPWGLWTIWQIYLKFGRSVHHMTIQMHCKLYFNQTFKIEASLLLQNGYQNMSWLIQLVYHDTCVTGTGPYWMPFVGMPNIWSYSLSLTALLRYKNAKWTAIGGALMATIIAKRPHNLKMAQSDSAQIWYDISIHKILQSCSMMYSLHKFKMAAIMAVNMVAIENYWTL